MARDFDGHFVTACVTRHKHVVAAKGSAEPTLEPCTGFGGVEQSARSRHDEDAK